MPCSFCGAAKVVARGLCSNCYQRQRNRGTLTRKNLQRQAHCVIEGCEREVFARNLCGLHYARAKDNRHATWKLLRSRSKGAYPPSWDSFDAFCADVGERPTPKHQLRRRDVLSPYSVANVLWVTPIAAQSDSETAYSRAWAYDRKYKLSIPEYDAMLAAQGHVCAICKKAETVTVRDKVRELCVDHDHATNKVRGLLCARCNRGIGYLGDSIENLASALAYLRSYA